MCIRDSFGGVHFGFNDDENFSAGETWSRVCGPFFIYLNKVAQGTANPPAALYACLLYTSDLYSALDLVARISLEIVVAAEFKNGSDFAGG